MIELKHVCSGYENKLVLEDFSLTLPQSGVTVLSGPSGCGKTTLLRLLAGLEAPQSGCISGLDPKRTAVLFQEDRLFPHRTVAQHLTDVLPRERHGELDHWLAFAELQAENNHLPRQLSGGMCRRLALARALALGGDLYLLDEPFTGIDLPRRRKLMDSLRDLNAPVIVVSHEPEIAELADHVIHLDGPPLQIK